MLSCPREADALSGKGGLEHLLPRAVQYLSGRESYNGSEAIVFPVVSVSPHHHHLTHTGVGTACLLARGHLIPTDGGERDAMLFAKEGLMVTPGWHLKPINSLRLALTNHK